MTNPIPEPRPLWYRGLLLIIVAPPLFWFHIDNRIMLAHVEDEQAGYVWN